MVTTTDNIQDIDPGSVNNDCNCDSDKNQGYKISDFGTNYD